MLWLDRPPWGRWLAASALICLAIWFEANDTPPSATGTEAVVETSPALPAGWWAFPVELTPGAATGDRVLVLVVDTGLAVEGIVASPPSDDPFGGGRGTVAVPPDHATTVAAAAAAGGVVVLTSTG